MSESSSRDPQDLSGIWCPCFATKYHSQQVQHNHSPLDQLFLSPPRESALFFPRFQDCIGIPSSLFIIMITHTLSTTLLERNTFLDYRAGWLEALGNLARYCIVIAGMVPTATQVSSSLTTAAVNGGLRTSPVGFEHLFCGDQHQRPSRVQPATRSRCLAMCDGLCTSRLSFRTYCTGQALRRSTTWFL
jgi:hypothetical protein